MNGNCCPQPPDHKAHAKKFDFILHGSLSIILLSTLLYMLIPGATYLQTFVHAVFELLGTMWWGIVMGITFVGLMSKIPREYFNAVLGRGDRLSGIIRATIAGLFLDLCSHGILMVGAKLYERGASLPQVMAFLIASPWNSLSLTIILIALIGLKWTLLYVAASALIAIITGMIYIKLISSGTLPPNPHAAPTLDGFSIAQDAGERMRGFRLSAQFFKDIAKGGWTEGRMLIRWLLLGVILASLIRTFVPPDMFADWFGPTMFGLVMTLIATTIIEVCSEGSAPIASEIFNTAHAPGNAFAFLMAGVSTDYTEIMIIREFSKSWLIAFSLPLITVPQVLLLGYIMNMAS